jgi:hypothetical protein
LNPGPRAKNPPTPTLELYDLAADAGETTNLAERHWDVVARLQAILTREHTPSELFPLRGLGEGEK